MDFVPFRESQDLDPSPLCDVGAVEAVLFGFVFAGHSVAAPRNDKTNGWSLGVGVPCFAWVEGTVITFGPAEFGCD